MKNTNSQAILARLTEAAGVATSGALSGFLGVSSQAVYDAKKKEKIPDSWIRTVAEQTGVSADWLFFGRGPMRFEDPAPPAAKPQPTTSPATFCCARCVKLETRIELLEDERRELSAENRQWAAKTEQLLRENGILRERCATLEERQKKFDPTNLFNKQSTTSSNKAQLD